jgi:ABC-type lipoprotein release transport system permease subunit
MASPPMAAIGKKRTFEWCHQMSARGKGHIAVLLQFLAEAIFLGVTGGIAGIIMGIMFSAVISAVAGWSTPISALAIFGAFLFSVVHPFLTPFLCEPSG